ncbi:hypothetical protein CRE_07464 [Caenorhabditis remanei]|uniref:Uncharacterized protein n=1 Tax=Caenorhabditis remanei TaxID=31234 RepID=E3M2P2_CAERE|nr:hypothetical protein CRE_07464 [Caenorhabditis remanei]
MAVIQKFIEDTFDMMTGLGEMKVSEAIFLDALDCASKRLSESAGDGILMRKLISLAYKGQNIIKMCVHLPRDSKAEKYAFALNQVSHEIDSLFS